MKTFPTVMAGIVLACGACSGTVQGALIAYEPFDYAEGTSLVAQSNPATPGYHAPVGFTTPYVVSNSAATGGTVSSPGFGYTNGASLSTAGNKWTSVANTGVYMDLPAGTYGGANGGTYYLSFLSQNTTAGNVYNGVSLFNNTTASAFVGRGGTEPNWRIEGVGTTTASTSPAATLSLLVVKYDFGATGYTVSLFVNPDLTLGEPAAASATATAAVTPIFNRLRLAGNSGNVDEIRFGTTWADVTPVPEPSIVGAGAVVIGLLSRRFRKASM